VQKVHILDAAAEAASPEEAAKLTSLKKADLAEATEELLNEQA
jgi:hypothetical protein